MSLIAGLYLVSFGFCINDVKDKVKQVERAQINHFVNDNSEKGWEISHNIITFDAAHPLTMHGAIVFCFDPIPRPNVVV